MNAYVIQILAMGLTISQLFTKPVDEFRTHFNEKADQEVVKALIHDGCGLVLKTFAKEGFDVEPVWKGIMSQQTGSPGIVAADNGDSTGADDSGAPAPTLPSLMAKMDPPTMFAAYQEICKSQTLPNSPVHLDEVIAYFNETLKKLPDHAVLKNFRFKEASVLKDGAGNVFSEIYEDQNRRKFVPVASLKPFVAQAFVSAEDKNFYEHENGLDLNGIVRAFIMGFVNGGDGKKRPPGGSTIDQQVIKNILLDSSVEISRKMKEMVLAARMAKLLTRQEVLELYLNYVFLGRASWGIDMAARSYFGHPASQLTLSEAATLAGLNRGPNFYNPDLRPDEVEKRRLYVLDRMAKDKPELAAEVAKAKLEKPVFRTDFAPPRSKGALYLVDEIKRQAKKLAGINDLTDGSYTVRSTFDPELQRRVEAQLQNGLANYEAKNGRAVFTGRVGTLAPEIRTYKKEWTDVIQHIRSKLYDVQWPIATVLQPATGGRILVGLQDGSTAWLNYGRVNKTSAENLAALEKFDLVHVDSATKTKSGSVQLKIPPQVQGAVVVLEAKTGRVLALTGGFSYPGSQYNRATQGVRQPGSTFKPFIYTYALDQGLGPNTLIPNIPAKIRIPGRPEWAPGNYDETTSGPVTMTWALENSLNVPASNMIARVNGQPIDGLNGVCNVARDLGVYDDCDNLTFPVVLGAREARVIDMAVGYAAIANLGLKPTAYVFDSIIQGDREVWRRPFAKLRPVVKTNENDPNTIRDQASFYQMRRLMEGVITRGTALAYKDLSGYVAGKTGTSNNWNDAWFIGFTNDVVVATWVGYDNPKGQKPRTLGRGQTGASVALPIGGELLRAFVRQNPVPLQGAPAGVANRVVELQMSRYDGTLNQGDVTEVFRRDMPDPRYKIVTNDDLRFGIGPRAVADGDAAVPAQNDSFDRPDADPDHYRPGQDDQYQMWRDQNRRVDPALRSFYGY